MVMHMDKAGGDHPVVLSAHLDPGLSRWQWLVKWFLAIPHYFLLAFLWLFLSPVRSLRAMPENLRRPSLSAPSIHPRD